MCGGGILKSVLPVLGGLAGTAFLSPEIGAALGSGLAGTIAGPAIGSAAGSALAGGNLKQDLLSGAEAAGTAGLLGSSDIGQGLGLSGSIGDTLSNTFGLTPNTNTADLGITSAAAPSTNLQNTFDSLGLTPNTNTADLGVSGSTVGSPVSAAPTGGTGITGEFASGLAGNNPSLIPSTSNVVNQAVGQAATGSASGGASGGILNFLKNNANLLLPAAGVAQDVVASRQQPKGLNQLEQQAASSNALANNLINSEVSGQLPAGQQQAVQNQLNDAVSSIRAKFASMGLTGSTMEQQAIQQAQADATAQTAQLAQQATATGLQALGASDNIYQAIMQAVLGQNQNISKSLANLASAATGTKPTVNVTV